MPSNAIIEAQTKGYTYKVRAPRARPIQLTQRDVDLIAAVYKYRVLHRGQVEDLFFAGVHDEGSSARRRLNLLYQHGYLERIPRFISPPANNPGPAYRLAQRGAVELASRQGIPHKYFNYWGKSEDRDSHRTKVGHAHLEHNLMLADIRMAFERQASIAGFQIATWIDYFDLLPSWKTERVQVRVSPSTPDEDLAIAPDGYFVIVTEKGRGHFFLEADRGTETVDRQWKRKILSYKEYLVSGKFHERYQVDNHVGYRVITIAPTRKRAENLRKASEKFGSTDPSKIFLFTSQTELLTSTINSSIWLRGGDSAPHSLL